MRSRLPVLIAVAALVLAACGGGDDDPTLEVPTDATTDGAMDDPMSTEPMGTESDMGHATETETHTDSGAAVTASLDGAQVPGGGDEDGSGEVTLTFNDPSELCYDLSLTNVEGVTAMHIHTGAPGENGGVAIPLETPSDTGGQACAEVEAGGMVALNDLRAGSGGYYLNVHTEAHPDGAVRADLNA